MTIAREGGGDVDEFGREGRRRERVLVADFDEQITAKGRGIRKGLDEGGERIGVRWDERLFGHS